MCRPFVVVVVDKIARTWLCSWNFVMSPSSTGSVDPNLLSPPTSTPILPSVFYSQSATRNRPVTPPQNASIPTSTPISNKTSGNHSYASGTHDRDSANYRLAQETSGYFLGAMPPRQFLKNFLATDEGTPVCPDSEGAFESVLRAKKEVDMYAPFVRRLLCFRTYCALPAFNR
jgi:hypothetical protein